jgi:hypothetical protein
MRLTLPGILQRRKIVDACIFFNEIDLLIVRFEELWNRVDHFLVVEADATFSGLPKPFFVQEYQERLKPYRDKLVYRTITLPPMIDDGEDVRLSREAIQRNALVAAVADLDLSRSDIVLVSDVDEIPRACHLDRLNRLLARREFAIFMLHNYRGYINNISATALNGVTFAGTVACRAGTLLERGAQEVRFGGDRSGGVKTSRSAEYAYVDDGGWHFSSIGGPDAFWLKAASFSHIEDPYRVIDLSEQAPLPQVFFAAASREQCSALQKKYLTHCASPTFSPLAYDTFEIRQDVPAFIRRHKEQFRGYFFFTDLI